MASRSSILFGMMRRHGKAQMSETGKFNLKLLGKADAIRTDILNRVRKAASDKFLDWEMMNWLADNDKAPDSLFTEIIEKIINARQVAVCAEREQERMKNMEWSKTQYSIDRDSVTPEYFGLSPDKRWRLPTVAEIIWGFHNGGDFHPYVLQELWVSDDPGLAALDESQVVCLPSCSVKRMKKSCYHCACLVRDKPKQLHWK